MPDVIVTNFNRNFTGVSATAAGVLRAQLGRYDLVLCGHSLPGAPAPVSKAEALRLSRAPGARRVLIWHVRRNSEMRLALWARDIRRLPVRIVFTSAAQRRHSAFPRWLISRMDAIIATTERAAEFVSNVQAVVPHGVDTEIFHPAADLAAAWAASGYPGQRGIATIGRIRPEKGTDRFIAAMLQFLPQNPDVTALVIGRAAPRHQNFLEGLKQKIIAAGLEDRIRFPGEIAPVALPGLLRSLSAVVQLPRYEGYGMAPLEAMASGVPFIATNQGYYRDFSQDGATGLIVEPTDTASALEACLNTPARHSAMSQTARHAAETRHSITQEADGIAAVYERLWSSP